MKKILTIIAFAFIAITANAQFNQDRTEFRLGEYVFKLKEVTFASLYDHEYECILDSPYTAEEDAYNLWYYIRIHRAEICKKYNVDMPRDVLSMNKETKAVYPQYGQFQTCFYNNGVCIGICNSHRYNVVIVLYDKK